MMHRMVGRDRGGAAWAASGLWLSTVAVGLAGAALTVVAWGDLDPADSYTNFGGAVAAMVYATLGALVVRRVGNRVGWIMLAEGLGFAFLSAASAYAVVGIASTEIVAGG